MTIFPVVNSPKNFLFYFEKNLLIVISYQSLRSYLSLLIVKYKHKAVTLPALTPPINNIKNK